MNSPIIFFGSEEFSAYSLNALLDANAHIAAIVTKPDSKRGRGKTVMSPAVKTIGTSRNIPVLQPANKHELEEVLAPFTDIQPVGVLVSYGMIIPQSVIDMFTPGIINLHPSLLPKYRGPAPIENTILRGDQETGVTIMKLDSKMDAGPIYAFSPVELTGTETQSSLYETLGVLGAQILAAALPDIVSGAIHAAVQDEVAATYTSLLTKQDATTDASRLTAAEIERKVRAYERYPKTKLVFGEHTIQPLKTHVSEQNIPTELVIECKDQTLLVIDSLIAPSGKRMSGADFLRGYRA